MIPTITKNNRGFVALMSVIIISVILLLMATTLSRTGFSGRLNILDSEYKERSSALAEACVDTALLKFVTVPSYNPINECVPVGDSCPDGLNVCKIVSITSSPWTIKTQAKFNNAYTNLEVIINSDYKVVSWKEVANF